MKVTPETVVLIDCNCNEIQKIARAVRSAKVYTMVMPCSVPLERLQAEKPVGIIFCADKNEPELAAKATGIAQQYIAQRFFPFVWTSLFWASCFWISCFWIFLF